MIAVKVFRLEIVNLRHLDCEVEPLAKCFLTPKLMMRLSKLQGVVYSGRLESFQQLDSCPINIKRHKLLGLLVSRMRPSGSN